MNSRLRALLVAVGTLMLSGVGITLLIPKEGTVLGDLVDAGVAGGQRVTLVCPERLSDATLARLRLQQPVRQGQRYGRIARVAFCSSSDGGNCFRLDGGLLPGADRVMVVPSVRIRASDGGDDVDDAFQFQLDNCSVLSCAQVDTQADAGTFLNPYGERFCGGPNRLALQPPRCARPVAGDGGVVNCRFNGPYALPDGGARWMGHNALPRSFAVGNACVPVECGVVSGDSTEGL